MTANADAKTDTDTDTDTDATRLAVTGATGQMGEAVLAAAADRSELAIALAVNRDPGVETSSSAIGVEIEPAADLDRLVGERGIEVLVDFTGPASAIEYMDTCVENEVAFVTGTTGFDTEQLNRFREASEATAVLRASNFSPGVQALLSASERVVETLPDYDVELTETHHNRKRDAPSGTATTILDRIEASRGGDAGSPTSAGSGDSADSIDSTGSTTSADSNGSDRVYGREGTQPREAGEIGVHVRRAGDVRGEHEVLCAGNDEVLTLTHRAESRRVFAAGALDAAAWLAGREPGLYEFVEVLG